jgi:hypothetical protein
MKKKSLLLFLPVMTISCGVFLGENPRSFMYKMESGEAVSFHISENRFPFTERRSLIVKSTGKYPLKGIDCEDLELKKFSDEVWFQIAKKNDLAGIKSATVMLEKESVQGTPKYCDFGYSRKNSGEWIQD